MILQRTTNLIIALILLIILSVTMYVLGFITILFIAIYSTVTVLVRSINILKLAIKITLKSN